MPSSRRKRHKTNGGLWASRPTLKALSFSFCFATLSPIREAPALTPETEIKTFQAIVGVIIMKCESCGKRLKKSDEVCPECGKYISREKTKTHKTQVEVSASANNINSENVIVYKANITNMLFKLLTAVFYIGFFIYDIFARGTFYGPVKFVTIPLFILSGFYLCFDAIASFISEKNCSLTFEHNRVHGTVPKKRYGKQEITIKYEDIHETEISYGYKREKGYILLMLKSDSHEKIYCSHAKTLKEIDSRLKKHIAEFKGFPLNKTVIYNGETVEGELINGKEYTLVEIDEDGMYEIIDESGETGFYYPEFFEITDSE